MSEAPQPKKTTSATDDFGIEFCPLKYIKKK